MMLLLSRVAIQVLDAVGLVFVGFLGAILAGTFRGDGAAKFLSLDISIEPDRNFGWITLAVAGFFALKSVLGILLLRITVLFLARVESDASLEVAEHLYTRDLRSIRTASRGEIQRMLDSSTREAFFFILFSTATIVTEISLFAVILATFLFIDPLTTVGLLIFFLILLGLFQLVVTGSLRALGSRTARLTAKMNNSTLDLVASFREAAVLDKRIWFLNRFDQSRRRLARNRAIERFTMSVPRYLVESSLLVGVALLAVWQIESSQSLSGLASVAVFLAGGMRMIAALVPMQNAINELGYYAPQAASAQQIIKEASVSSKSNSTGGAAFTGVREPKNPPVGVSVRNVIFCYPDEGIPAVDEVTLAIRPGEFAAFVGPSGAGKTTLVDIILGLHIPLEGEVALDGQVPSLFRKNQPGGVAYVPQAPAVISGTVAQNVAIGEDKKTILEDRVIQVLEQVGLGPKVAGLPRGIQTRLGGESNPFSAGELQRLGIARALYSYPSLIVMDEATSALDAESEAIVGEIIERLRGNTTLIVIAHRLSTIQYADIVFLIEMGRVVDSGSLTELRRRNARVERYVQIMNIE